MIENCKAKIVFISPETIENLDINWCKKRHLEIIKIENSNDGVHNNSITSLDLNQLDQVLFDPFNNVTENNIMALVYTSGTTAEPKAIFHSISDFVNNAKTFGKILGIDENSRFYNNLAITYLGGFYNLLFLPYVCGSSIVLTQTFNPNSLLDFWRPIIKHKVNTLWLIPSMMSLLMEMDRGKVGEEYCKKNISYNICGTAPLPIQLRIDFEKRYGIKVYENYGMAETLFISTNNPEEKVVDGSVGKLLPDVSVKIVDDEDKELSFNSEGEILVKTPYLMKDSNFNSSNDSKTIWTKTGDIGILSENGDLSITGRKKDLIIKGGVNISPVSIENLIHSHQDVNECAVVGIPHKFQGEEIIAVVRITPSSDFDLVKNQLVKLCDKNLSKIKIPNGFLQLPEFPHNSYGKIQKRKIRAWLIQNKKFDFKKPVKTIQKIVKKPEIEPSKIALNSVEAMSIKFNTIVYEKQRKGEDVIVMSLGEAFFDIPLYSFNELPTEKIYHYSHSLGIPELREKISQYFLKNYDVNFDYEKEILITAGSKIAIHMSLMATINPGDEVLIHEPAWVSYPEQIKLCYGVPINVPYHESVFNFEKYISPKTKMIIVNNPNNPTGKVFNLEELSFLYHLAQKYNLYILSDEAYSDFVLNQDEFVSFAHLDTEKKYSIIINSISKNFGISGWRIGYIITNSALIHQLLKLNQHMITCPPTILEYYVSRYFNEIIKITKRMRVMINLFSW